MQDRVYFVLPVVAALFLAGFVANLVTGEVRFGDSIVQWSIAGVALVAFWFIRRNHREHEEFFAFIAANEEAIRAGTARYQGEPLSYATRLRIYHMVLSFLFVSFRTQSQLIVHPSRRAMATRIGYDAVNLIFGWWGIPWGPIWTVRAILSNARGKDEMALGEIIEGAWKMRARG